MIVTAWSDGKNLASGAGYGLKLTLADRDRYFKREWPHVVLELEGHPAPITVRTAKPSFWDGACRELISKEIGKWLRQNELAPWPKGKPPKLVMEPLTEGRFVVRKRPL